jgi:hypothetical protein
VLERFGPEREERLSGASTRGGRARLKAARPQQKTAGDEYLKHDVILIALDTGSRKSLVLPGGRPVMHDLSLLFRLTSLYAAGLTKKIK